jgi:hypothetical protein
VNPAIKIIRHGLASGRVQSTPEVLGVLKKLKHDQQSCVPGSDHSGKPAMLECDSAARQGEAEEQPGLTLNRGTHES